MALSPQFLKKNGVALDSVDTLTGLDNFAVLFSNGVYPEMGITIKIDTSLGNGSNAYRWANSSTGSYTIFWGDQTANQVVQSTIIHTYSTGGQYEIACRSSCGEFAVTTTETSREKLIDVLQFGSNGRIKNANVFANADNLANWTATDAPPDVTSGQQTSFVRVFDYCDVWNGDLSSWDVSAATTFQEFFRGCTVFNNDSIVNWDTGNVANMSQMFRYAPAFNQDIGGWDTSSLTNPNTMFNNATNFNQDISGWNMSNVTTMQSMFNGARAFNQDISGWNISSCTNLRGAFNNAESFNQDLSNWDTSNVTDFRTCFANCPIGDLTNWDVSNANPSYGLSSIFQSNNVANPNMSNWKWPSVPFNANDSLKFFRAWTGGDITTKVVNPGTPDEYTAWDMSECTSMHELFSTNTAFNGDCTNWDVGNVTDLSLCFAGTSFNRDISSWNVANVANMSNMFPNVFSQDLSSWVVSSVTNMNSMRHSQIGDTTGWDMSSVVTATGQTMGNRNYGTWNLAAVENIQLGVGMSSANQANTIIGWAGNSTTNTGASSIPLFTNSTQFSKSATTGSQGYDGQAAYNGFLRLVAPTPNVNRASGTNTSTAADKLIDLGATFTASVNEGDVVANTTSGTYSVVETVDSDTQLTLEDDIFTSTSQSYSVDGGYGWTITGITFIA